MTPVQFDRGYMDSSPYPMIWRTIRSVIRILPGVLLLACNSPKAIHLQGQLASSVCGDHRARSTGEAPWQPYDPGRHAPTLADHFSPRSLLVAHATGTLPLLEQLLVQGRSPQDDGHALRLLDLRLTLQQRLSIAALEVSAAAAEMDCEEERADQIATFLSGKEADAETRLTVAAIIVGATGAILSGSLLAQDRDDNAVEIVGVGTGIIEVGLGLAILLNKRKVRFEHPRNALGEVWEGRERSQILPPAVWAYLDHRENGAPSLRDQLLAKWTGFGQVENDAGRRKRKQGDATLYYGDGGVYTSDQLTNRANMYDQLESYINLMHQDILRLALEIEALR